MLPSLRCLSVVRLPDYGGDEELLYFEPNSPWTLTYLRMVNSAIKRLLSREDKEVQFIEISRTHYWRWLAKNQKVDSPETRAAYVAEAVRGRP